MFGREPALWAGAIRAVLLCVMLFGVPLTDLQVGAIMLAVEAILTLITRRSSVPNAKISGGYEGSKVGGTVTGVMLALAACILAGGVTPAEAVTGNVIDIERAAVGVDVGPVYYEPSQSDQPIEMGLRVSPWLSWSLSDQLSAVGKYGVDVKYGRHRKTAGLRASVYGYEGDVPTTRRMQLGLSFDRVWLSGDNLGIYAARSSYAAGINASWLLLATAKRDLLSLKPQVSYDHLNGFDAALSVGLSY